MGWWKTGQGDDIIGDDPADTIIGALKSSAEWTGTKPSFQEIVDATANLIQFDGERFVSDADSASGKAIVAAFAEPAPTLRSQSIETTKLGFKLLSAFEEIAEQYLNTDYNRKPRVNELLAAMSFVLRTKPERYLRDAAGLELKEFRLET